MATKKTNTPKKTAVTAKNKKTTVKKVKIPAKKVSAVAAVTDSKRTLVQRIKDMRQERAERKADLKRHKQTDKARQEKAKQRAIRENALEQVEQAVIKSKRRKSRPGLTLFFALVLAGLGGFAAYQYRQIELDDKVSEISELKADASSFQELQSTIEADKQAEADKFKTVSLENNATIRVPKDWVSKDSSLPGEEQILGDKNVTMRIVSSESRNSTSQFIPTLDYVWTIASTNVGGPLQVQSKSLHCERFDTFSNDLGEARREHQGFTVFCDDNSERIEIAALSTPEQYGTAASDTYFLISIEDVQQVDFESLVEYIESYTR